MTKTEKLRPIDTQEQIDLELAQTIIIPFLKNFILSFTQLKIQSPKKTIVERIETATRYAKAKTPKLKTSHQILFREMIVLGKISNPSLDYEKAVEIFKAQLAAFEDEISLAERNHD